jgi:hypothetical protein
MNYQTPTAWIFVLLVLTVLFMGLFPTPTVIGLGIIVTPILVLIQTYIILTAQTPEDLPSAEDQWYES